MALAQELTFASATDLHARMAGGELSPVELLDACLARIEEVDPRVNAFIELMADEAHAAARDSEQRFRRGEARPLEGLPVPIKDIAIVAGTTFTMGSRMALDFPLPFDSEVVARLRNAGAVIFGKTHMPEFGSTVAGESVRHGATRNPWDLERTPGGSSSGAGAAVAAGMAPVAHGADGGGSLRIPAAACGLFTIKPTRGRISMEPLGDITENTVYGYITRSVMDNALLIDQTQGYALGDPYWSSPLARPLAEEVGADPGRLRIGWTVKPPLDVEVHPEWAAAVESAAGLCENLGHEVEHHDIDWVDEDVQGMFLVLWSAEFSFVVEQLRRFGLDPSLLEPHNQALWELGKEHSASEYVTARGRVHDMLKRVLDSWSTYDVVLSPVMAQPPPPIGWLFEDADKDPLSPLLPRSAMITPFTALFNFTGQPAASLPLAWSRDGLPIGIQAIGNMGDEATLFRLSAQLEQARPWADRRPRCKAVQLTGCAGAVVMAYSCLSEGRVLRAPAQRGCGPRHHGRCGALRHEVRKPLRTSRHLFAPPLSAPQSESFLAARSPCRPAWEAALEEWQQLVGRQRSGEARPYLAVDRLPTAGATRQDIADLAAGCLRDEPEGRPPKRPG